MEGGRREVEGSKVELAENKLILGQIYSTLFYSSLPLPQSKWTIKESRNNERKKMESSGFDLAENNGADF